MLAVFGSVEFIFWLKEGFWSYAVFDYFIYNTNRGYKATDGHDAIHVFHRYFHSLTGLNASLEGIPI